MDGFIALVESESWRELVQSREFDLGNGITGTTFMYVAEFSGVKFDPVEGEESRRQDIVAILPVLVIRGLPNAVVNDEQFELYVRGRLPLTQKAIGYLGKPTKDELLILEFESSNAKKVAFKLPLNDPVISLADQCGNLCVAIQQHRGLVFGRASSKPVDPLPEFPVRTGSVLNAGRREARLRQLIQNVSRYPLLVLGRVDSYLGVNIGSSNYDVYQSTRDLNSLPKVTNLGGVCLACGDTKTSKEHCSPKWLADREGVEPLVAPILCEECNGWFGEIEARMADFTSRPIEVTESRTLMLIVRWAVKTALTMSVASGVRAHLGWLPYLRNKRLPDGFTVYFDPNQTLAEPGFAYGVSRFSERLWEEQRFLFSLSTPLFTMCVVRSDGINVDVPLLEIFPRSFRQPSHSMPGSLADMHQQLHESISGEATVPNDLPHRPQSPRT